MPFVDPAAKKKPQQAADPVLLPGVKPITSAVVRPPVAPAPSPASAAPLPEIPSTDNQRPQAFEGARDVAKLSDAIHTAVQPQVVQPITADTPQSELAKRAGNMRFDLRAGNGMGEGVAYRNSPAGMVHVSGEPDGLLRPRTGPESPAGLAGHARIAAQLHVPDIPQEVGSAAGLQPAASAPQAMPAGIDPRVDNMSADNLAAAKRFTAPDNGAPGPQTQQPGVTVGDRHVGVGAMVDGVPTFSDGTGGIARTMTDAQISGMGDRLQTAPAQITPLASDTMGGATPTQQQMVAQRMAQTQQPITGSRPSAAQFAASDRAAIATRDPRSALGTAAHNLGVETEFARTPRSRAAAAAQLAQLGTGTDQANLQGVQDDAAMARTQATNATTLANTALTGQNTLANTKLESTIHKPGSQFADEKGNLWLSDSKGGASMPVLGPDGKQLKQAVTKDDTASKRTQAIQDQLGKGVQDLLAQYQKDQALLPPDQQAPATPDIIKKFRLQQAQALGIQIGNDEAGQLVGNFNGQKVLL